MLSVVAAVALVSVSLSRVVLVNGVVFSVEFEVTVTCTVELFGVAFAVGCVRFKSGVVTVGVTVKFPSCACATGEERARRQQARVAKVVLMAITSCTGKQKMR